MIDTGCYYYDASNMDDPVSLLYCMTKILLVYTEHKFLKKDIDVYRKEVI